MATYTLTLTQPEPSMASTSVPNIVAGSVIPAQNKTATVQFQDDAANTIKIVGSLEMLDNFSREIMKAIRP